MDQKRQKLNTKTRSLKKIWKPTNILEFKGNRMKLENNIVDVYAATITLVNYIDFIYKF